VLPTLNTIPHNVTPIIAVTPMNGTLAPNSQQVISIRASIPSGDKPYLKWQGVLSVVEIAPAANITGGAGAVIREGVAKIVTIESAPPKGIPLIYYLIASLVIVIVAVVAAYAMLLKKKSRMAVAKKKAMIAEAKARLRGRTTRRTRRATKKLSARKSSPRKTRKGAGKSRPKKNPKPEQRTGSEKADSFASFQYRTSLKGKG
jgi:hypothetical protein